MKINVLSVFFVICVFGICAGEMVWAEAAGSSFTYQGHLYRRGAAVSGKYDLLFTLYDQPEKGDQMCKSLLLERAAIEGGSFSVELDFGFDVFRGEAMWLEIGVREPDSEAEYTILQPRQQVTAVPYALYALSGNADSNWRSDGYNIYSAVNGNVGIGTAEPSSKLEVKGDIAASGNIYGNFPELQLSWNSLVDIPAGFADGIDDVGPTSLPWSSITGIPAGFADGIDNDTLSTIAVSAGQIPKWNGSAWVGSADLVGGITGVTAGAGLSGGGTSGNITLSLASPLSSTLYITTDFGPGLWATATSNGGYGVYGLADYTGNYTNFGGYFKAAAVYGRGVYGEASSTSGDIGYPNCGGYFLSRGKYGRGVYGSADNSASLTINYGGYFESAGTMGYGVYGSANSTANSTNYGGYFKAGSVEGRGVYGYAAHTGIAGNYSPNYGGYFEAAGQAGRGVYGSASNNGNSTNYGGYFEAAGQTARAVYGNASNPNGGNIGGAFQSAGSTGIGVNGTASGTSGTGVLGGASGSQGRGVVGSGTAYDFYAVGGGGVAYGVGSSVRWKSDIRPIDAPLEKVAQIRGVYFTWDEEHGGNHDVGMIAEEVGRVLPEAVAYEENGMDASGMDYSKTTPLLIEAIKALKYENEQLKARLEAVEAVIAEIRGGA